MFKKKIEDVSLSNYEIGMLVTMLDVFREQNPQVPFIHLYRAGYFVADINGVVFILKKKVTRSFFRKKVWYTIKGDNPYIHETFELPFVLPFKDVLKIYGQMVYDQHLAYIHDEQLAEASR